MHSRLVFLILFAFGGRAFAQSGIPAEALRSATFSYQSRINTIVLQAVIPELAKHFNLLRAGSVKFSFRLDRQGRLSRLRVTSSTSNRFVEQTTVQMIRATRFPPIPKKVIAEQRHDFVDVDSEINLDRNRT
jgi:TonB family protein